METKLSGFTSKSSMKSVFDNPNYVSRDNSEYDGDIDLLNNVTFGDGIDLNEDWEDEHNKFAGVKTVEVYENGVTDHKNLEFSLRQLVIDSEEEEENSTKETSNIPIPKTSGNSDLDGLFGPSSPPGFLNTETLVSPSRTNIWGSPTKEDLTKMCHSSNEMMPSMHSSVPGFENSIKKLHNTEKGIPLRDLTSISNNDMNIPPADSPLLSNLATYQKEKSTCSSSPLSTSIILPPTSIGRSNDNTGDKITNQHRSHVMPQHFVNNKMPISNNFQIFNNNPLLCNQQDLFSHHQNTVLNNRVNNNISNGFLHQSPVNLKNHPSNINRKPTQAYHQYHQQRYQQHNSVQQNHKQRNHNNMNSSNRSWNRHNSQDDEHQPSEEYDEYDGLMLQTEKDWIIRIQMSQLTTDNPYMDDYYYTTWMMHKLVKERKLQQEGPSRDNGNEIQLILPQLAKIESRGYRPAQFNGSLGKLTAASVHNPRAILDIDNNKVLDNESVLPHGQRFKELLMFIEKCYEILLDIDVIEKQALAMPDEDRSQKFEERKIKLSDLFDRIYCKKRNEKLFLEIVSVRKGLTLVMRLIPLLDKVQCVQIVSDCLKSMNAFNKKSHNAELIYGFYLTVSKAFHRGDITSLNTYSNILCLKNFDNKKNKTNKLITVLQNKLYCSFLWCLIEKGENVFIESSFLDSELEQQDKWIQFVRNLGDVILKMKGKHLTVPYNFSIKCVNHLERFLNKRIFVQIEDKLNDLLTRIENKDIKS